MYGESTSGLGVLGLSINGHGVSGSSSSGDGVRGRSDSSYGVRGDGFISYGVYAQSVLGIGLYAQGPTYAGHFEGKVHVTDRVSIGFSTATPPLDNLHLYGNLRLGYNAGDSCIRNFDGSTIIAGTCPSDARYKRDIRPVAPMLSRISQLRPVNFYWRSEEFPDKNFGKEDSYGLIAQEVEQVLPELVATSEQGFKSVHYSKLPLLTLQAIKELKSDNDALQQQNARQQQLLNALQKRLTTVERALIRKTRKRIR